MSNKNVFFLCNHLIVYLYFFWFCNDYSLWWYVEDRTRDGFFPLVHTLGRIFPIVYLLSLNRTMTGKLFKNVAVTMHQHENKQDIYSDFVLKRSQLPLLVLNRNLKVRIFEWFMSENTRLQILSGGSLLAWGRMRVESI